MAATLRTRRGNPGIPCEKCGAIVSPDYMQMHLSRRHKTKRRSNTSRKATAVTKKAAKATKRTFQSNGRTFTEVPFIVLDDGEGGVWIAERAFPPSPRSSSGG